jgi:hypothetical protein
MKKLLPVLTIALTATALLCPKPIGAQLVPPAKKASHV